MRHLPRNLAQNLGQYRALWRASNAIEARTTPCFRVVNKAAERPRFYVYDVIGGWDLDAEEFVRAVHQVDADEIDLHVNSPGGFVYDGVAMYEALAAAPVQVFAHVDGMAASAASFLVQAADDIETASAGRWMIHDAQGIGIGGPAEMREFADHLDAISDDISGIYAARAGGTPAGWRKAMRAETWYSSAEAVGAKLADRVARPPKEKDSGPDNRTRLITARHRALITRGG